MKFDTIWKIEKKKVFCSDLMTPVQFNRLFKYIYQMIINQYTCIKRSQWKFNTWVVNAWIFLQQALALPQLPNIKKIQIHINVYQLYCRINILFFFSCLRRYFGNKMLSNTPFHTLFNISILFNLPISLQYLVLPLMFQYF